MRFMLDFMDVFGNKRKCKEKRKLDEGRFKMLIRSKEKRKKKREISVFNI